MAGWYSQGMLPKWVYALSRWAFFCLVTTTAWGQSTNFITTTLSGGGLRTGGSDFLCKPAKSSPLPAATGLAIDQSGVLFMADARQGSICRILQTGEVTELASGLSLSASVSEPSVPIAVSRLGRVYFAERFNPVPPPGVVIPRDRIQSVSPDGRLSIVLNVTASALAISPGGNLVYAAGPAVYLMNENGTSTLLAGGRSGFSGDGAAATLAGFGAISGLAFDSAGTLFIADSGNRRVRKVSQGIITTVVVMSEPPVALASFPGIGVYVRAGGRVFLAAASELRLVAGGGIANTDGGPARDVAFGFGGGLAVSSDGKIFLSESDSLRQLLPSPTADENCSYSINASPTTHFASGGIISVDVVVSRPNCSWAFSSPHAWVSPSGATVRSGNGAITVAISPNESSVGRIARLWAAGSMFNAAQDGSSCSYAVEDERLSFAQAGGTGSVKISARPRDCTWSVSSAERWIFIGSTVTGRGDGIVGFSVGPNPGAIRTGTLSVTGTLVKVTQGTEADPPPSINPAGVLHAAALVSGPVSVNEVISIFGSKLGPSVGRSSELLVSELAGTIVTFDDIPGFITYVNDNQINVLIPAAAFNSGSRNLRVRVERSGLVSNLVTLPIVAATPGIYTLNGSGTGPAIAFTVDGALSTPSEPVARGSVITLWVTGAGATDPTVADGIQPAGPPFPRPTGGTSLKIGGIDAEMLFAGMVYSGVLQINAVVPPTLEPGQVSVVATVGVADSRSGVTISVR